MRNSGSRTAWSGYALEQVCLHHIPQIKKALGISGVLANVIPGPARPFVDSTGAEWRGGQIDMLIDRADGAINICEMKYAKDEFVMIPAVGTGLADISCVRNEEGIAAYFHHDLWGEAEYA